MKLCFRSENHIQDAVKPGLSDHCHERPPVLKDSFLAEGPIYFSIIESVTKDHLSSKTTFLGPMWWSFKTGFSVLFYNVS